MVPVEGFPPITLVGFRLNVEIVAGFIVNVTFVVVPWATPEIFVTTCELTPIVVTVNVAFFCPASTVICAGTVAAALSLVRLTRVPPCSAGPFKVIVPLDDVPPRTVVGFSAIELSVAA